MEFLRNFYVGFTFLRNFPEVRMYNVCVFVTFTEILRSSCGGFT